MERTATARKATQGQRPWQDGRHLTNEVRAIKQQRQDARREARRRWRKGAESETPPHLTPASVDAVSELVTLAAKIVERWLL